MKKLLSFLLVFAAVGSVLAQEEIAKTSAASKQYRLYREAMSMPTYGLAKVKGLIKKIKRDKEDNMRLSDKVYGSLTVEERFTYTMIHGEDSSQNCDVMMPVVDEEKKIFSFWPDAFGGESVWSDRQRQSLSNNRTKVIELLRATMKLRERAGANIKNAVMELKANELIPDLIAVYRIKRKDHDILTLLMLLMKEGQYPEFINSASYTKLYGEESNYKGFLEANSANQQLIMDRAMAFYKSLHK
ncbi:MAG: hypothetical protein WCG75_02990 [Armatimonadota bacterium]